MADVLATEATLEAMLSLQTGYHRELISSINHLSTSMGYLEERSDHTAHQNSDMDKSHKEAVNAHKEQAGMIQKLQLKVADLEDRSRCNHFKFMGMPKSVKANELLLDLSPRGLLDCAYRILKMAHLLDTVPRDFLARVHFYHNKHQLLRAARNACKLPPPYAGIALYQDLSAATAKRRKNFILITKVLQDKNLTKLLVMHQNQQVAITSLKEGFLKAPQFSLNISHQNTSHNIQVTREASQRQNR